MPLPDDYLEYPARRHGMDHDRYEWSHLFDREKIVWPNKAKRRPLGHACSAVVSDRHNRKAVSRARRIDNAVSGFSSLHQP